MNARNTKFFEDGAPLPVAESAWEGQGETVLTAAAFPELSVRTEHMLFRALRVRTVGELLALDAERVMSVRNCGCKTAREILDLRNRVFAEGPARFARRDAASPLAAEVSPASVGIVPIDPAAFESFAAYVESEAARHFDLSGLRGTVLRDCLALGAGVEKNRKQADVARELQISRARVNQIVLRIERSLFSGGAKAKYAIFADRVVEKFEAAGWVLPVDELLASIDAAFGWTGTTLANVKALLEELGHRFTVNQRGFCGLDVEAHGASLPAPISRRKRRLNALLEVLRTAGPTGLVSADIVARCREAYPDLAIDESLIRSCYGNGLKLDDEGTRLIGYDRGRVGGGTTRITLNSFFKDAQTRAVLEEAAQEIKAYMEDSGFGVVEVNKVWPDYGYRCKLPKLGFYNAMREAMSGGLRYPGYPWVAHADVPEEDARTDAAYGWELFYYFKLCGREMVTNAQAVSFLVDCLGMSRDRALAMPLASLGLKRNGADRKHHLLCPPASGKMPNLFLHKDKCDPSLSMISDNVIYAGRGRLIDKRGRARTVSTYVWMFMRKLESVGFAFDPTEMDCLLQNPYCREKFKIRRALFRRVSCEKKSRFEYTNDSFVFGDEKVYLCAEWDLRSKLGFDVWAAHVAQRARFRFLPTEISDE